VSPAVAGNIKAAVIDMTKGLATTLLSSEQQLPVKASSPISIFRSQRPKASQATSRLLSKLARFSVLFSVCL